MRLLFVLYALPLYVALLLTAAHCARWLTSEPQVNSLTAPVQQWLAVTVRHIATTIGHLDIGTGVSQFIALALDLLLVCAVYRLFYRVSALAEQLSNPLFKKPVRVIFALILVEVSELCRYFILTPPSVYDLGGITRADH